MLMNAAILPASGYVRLPQLVGQKEVTSEQAEANRRTGRGPRRPRKGLQPIVPVSAATLWRRVAAGEFPEPVKLGERVTAWRAQDVRMWLAAQGAL
jgi:hypothetical protein